MKNCNTCYLATKNVHTLYGCPVITNPDRKTHCFAWCLSEKEWEQRLEDCKAYEKFMLGRVEYNFVEWEKI